MKLLINADDFGYSPAVNHGIIETFKNGIVRSTTMMCGMPGFDHAVSLAKENPELGVGVHLTMTAGYSVGGVYKTITDQNGHFLKQIDFYNSLDTIDLGEIEKEFTAQIEKALAAGIKVTHIDSHHHVHGYEPVFGIFIDLAKRYGLPVRNFKNTEPEFVGRHFDVRPESIKELGLKTTDSFTLDFYGDTANAETLISLIKAAPGDSLEVMCHPAFLDLILYEGTGYGLKRIYEQAVLSSNEVKKYISENGIELINFRKL